MRYRLWNKEDLANFRVDYDNALLLKEEKFIFQGDWYDIDYAKYLIEYLTNEFNDENT